MKINRARPTPLNGVARTNDAAHVPRATRGLSNTNAARTTSPMKIGGTPR